MTDATTLSTAVAILGSGLCIPDEHVASALGFTDTGMDASILSPMVRRRTSNATRVAITAAGRACAADGALALTSTPAGTTRKHNAWQYIPQHAICCYKIILAHIVISKRNVFTAPQLCRLHLSMVSAEQTGRIHVLNPHFRDTRPSLARCFARAFR